ncbi:MAG: tetratricopeptide repeat protein [Vicinamibacterales bacterium]
MSVPARRRRRVIPSWQLSAWSVAIVVIVAAGSALLGLRSRDAISRLPPLPVLAGHPAPLVTHLEQADARARRSPRNADIIGALGMAYHADLFYGQAVIAYELAADLDPSDRRWPYYLALVHMERSELVRATHALTAVVTLHADDGLAWWRLGEAAFKQADYAAADAAYGRAESTASAANDQSDIAAYARVGRARVALNLVDTKTAVDILTKQLESTPRFGVAHRVLAEAYRAEGREADADRQARLGAALRAYAGPADPLVNALADISRSSVFLLRFAASHDLTRDAVRREQLVRRALESDADNPDVVYEVGALLQQLRRPADALPYFTRHLEMVSDDQQTLVQIAKCQIDLGRVAEAEATLRKALSLGDDAVGFHNLGVVLERQNRLPEAEASYRRAVALGPGLAGARNNLAVLMAAQSRLDEAALYLRESIRLSPAEADAYGNLSAVRFQQGAVADAAHLARLAIDLEPRHADAHANLGVALARLGDLDAAQRELQAALAIDPRHVNARRNLDALNRRE